MAQPNWRDFDDARQMDAAAAAHVAAVILAALDARGRACLAVPGGKTPVPIFELLTQDRRIDWERVVLLPTDDRLVALVDDLSNLHLIRSLLGSTGAKIVPLTSAAALDPVAAADYAEQVLRALDWPLDLLWLGMGSDGHTGSILPGPDFDRAVVEGGDRLAVAVTPDPLPPEAPVARVTLTRHAMTRTRSAMLTITGAAKRAVAERAIADGVRSTTAIGLVLGSMTAPVELFWSA